MSMRDKMRGSNVLSAGIDVTKSALRICGWLNMSNALCLTLGVFQ